MSYPRALAEQPIANIETEAALLGGLMIENRLIDKVADIIVPEDFAEPILGRVYSAILREHDMGRVANPVTLKPYFTDDEAMREVGGPGFLAQLTGSGAAVVGALDFAKQVSELSHRRRFAGRMNELAGSCRDWEMPLAELAALAESAIADALVSVPGAASMSAAKAVEAALDGMFDNNPGVRCQIIPSLDHALGAIAPGDVVIMASRPGMGKTATALAYSRGVAAQGLGVTFFSLEMRAAQLGGRLAAEMLFDTPGQVPYRAISECSASKEEARDIARASIALRELPIWIEDLPSSTVARLAALVRKHKRRLAARDKSLKLVVIDYLQLLRPDHREQNLYQATSMVSRGLKELAKAESVGILALCQLSRDIERRPDKRPVLSDLRESGQIEQDADAVCFLLRREEYLKREEPNPDTDSENWQKWRAQFERFRGKIEFIVAKRRNGTTGTGHGFWHGEYQAVRG